jgi:UDP-3-O-[3-hydroxymyristoyl] glucosamine N-acyltransferase
MAAFTHTGIGAVRTVGHGAVATGHSSIPIRLTPDAFLSGYPAVCNREWLKPAVYRRPPKLKKERCGPAGAVGKSERLMYARGRKEL